MSNNDKVGFFYVRPFKRNVPVACVAYKNAGDGSIAWQFSSCHPTDYTGGYNRAAARGVALLKLMENPFYSKDLDPKNVSFRKLLLVELANKNVPYKVRRAANRMIASLKNGSFAPEKKAKDASFISAFAQDIPMVASSSDV